ncbi:hypothetical protein ACA910_009054 [Epithemia clementina (nom. ined.)]
MKVNLNPMKSNLALLFPFLIGPGGAFVASPLAVVRARSVTSMSSSMSEAAAATTSNTNNSDMTCLVEPSARESQYKTNVAQYLVDLHDNQMTFDFCGGMLFQLVLSDKLREHLFQVAAASSSSSDSQQQQKQPKIFDASKMRMSRIPGYLQSAHADNVNVFHGREVRNVPNAKGGMGFVLHLSMASNDPEGWSKQELAEYNGWMHDTGRKWRKALDWQKEGFTNAVDKFGPQSFGLHHRFYWHLDGQNRVWLSAEDGCEGTPAVAGGKSSSFARFFGF